MKQQLKLTTLFISLSLFFPITATAWVDPTAFIRMFEEFTQSAYQGQMSMVMVENLANQVQQMRMQQQQIEMATVNKSLLKDRPDEESSGDNSGNLAEACKNGLGEGVCVIEMQKQKKAEGGIGGEEPVAEYSESQYAAGSPHTRLPKVYHEMEKHHSAADIFLRKKYFVQLRTIEKEFRDFNSELKSATSNATDIAVVQAKTAISLGKLKVLTAQLDAINTQLKMLDHKHQYEAVKQNMEASGRGKGSQTK